MVLWDFFLLKGLHGKIKHENDLVKVWVPQALRIKCHRLSSWLNQFSRTSIFCHMSGCFCEGVRIFPGYLNSKVICVFCSADDPLTWVLIHFSLRYQAAGRRENPHPLRRSILLSYSRYLSRLFVSKHLSVEIRLRGWFWFSHFAQHPCLMPEIWPLPPTVVLECI